MDSLVLLSLLLFFLAAGSSLIHYNASVKKQARVRVRSDS